VLAPPQALSDQDLVDPAPLDGDAPVLVEVRLQPVERPATEVQPQVLRGGQCGGDDLGHLLGRVGRRAALAGPVAQAGEALVVEAMEPLIELIAAHADTPGDGAGPLARGEAFDDLGPLDQPGLVGARAGESGDGLTLLGRQLTETDLGTHGAPPAGDAPILCPACWRMNH
jgi:hypothetical protein